MNYQEFIAQKLQHGADSGFEPLLLPDWLFGFQSHLVDWAIRKGRAAIFADCGLGKTPMQLVWAQNMVMKTNKPVLGITPLAVGAQTLEEAEKFGIEAIKATPGDTRAVIQIINYEQLHKFEPSYGAVFLDESSILKNFKGFRCQQIIEFMRTVPYRLLCTATASPNSFREMGPSSEALGYMGNQDMLKDFFTRNQRFAMSDRRAGAKEEYVLRPHAADGPFWQWLASWSRACRKPSDLGYPDNGFILPKLIENDIDVSATSATPGMLFDLEARNYSEELEATRRTIEDRCGAVADMVNADNEHWLVWCNLNDEGDLLEEMIPGSVQIAGRHSDDKKEEAATWFRRGSEEKRVLISKPKIFGFGMNFQHCCKVSYFPHKHSYESYYQAVRRVYRFGQKREVFINRTFTNGGRRMLKSIDRKAAQADEMFTKLVAHMNEEMSAVKDYSNIEIGVPQWM